MTLSGTVRSELGSTAAKHYRAKGHVPAVLYRSEGAVHFLLEANAVDKLLASRNTYLITLDIEGTEYTAILRAAQFHPVHDFVLDVEFGAVAEDRPITVDLPLRLKGTSPGMLAGGKLVQKQRKIRVKGLASNLPEEVVADISHLKLGKSMKVREMKSDKFDVVMAGDLPIATIEIPRSLRQEYAKENPGSTPAN